MLDARASLVQSTATLHEAVQVIDRNQIKIAIVVDELTRLVGTVTDGDVRRALLAGETLASPVSAVMSKSPQYGRAGEDPRWLLARMEAGRLRFLPIVDERRVVLGIMTASLSAEGGKRPNPVVLMAGGEGRRLRPLTESVPKPMLPVGPKPILETIVERFAAAGFAKFFISVNYKGELVEKHFGDGGGNGLSISYIRESRPLGTAGSLSLLPSRPAVPFFVMNGDILTKVDFSQLLDFHRDQRAAATMCVRSYEIEVPYGVVVTEGDRLLGITEKPRHVHFVNAGIYVLEPSVLDYVSAETEMSMPDLFTSLMADGHHCSVFPIREYWLDIGRLADFEQANMDFQSLFSSSTSERS